MPRQYLRVVFDKNRIAREWGALDKILKEWWSPNFPRDKFNVMRTRLCRFMKWCALEKIRPSKVTDEVMARHLAATRQTERLSNHIRRGNILRRAWNTAVDNVPGWPRTKVSTPHDRPPIDRPTTRLGQLVSLAPGAFHPSLLEDLQRYRDNDGLLFSKLPEDGKACSYHERMQHHIFELTEALTGNRVLADGGHRLKKLTSRTAYGHCRVICATATALHMSEVADILSLRSIADVVTPRAASVLADAQRKRGGLGLLKYAYHCAFILRSNRHLPSSAPSFLWYPGSAPFSEIA